MNIYLFAQSLINSNALPKNDMSDAQTVLNAVYIIIGSVAVIVVIYAGIQLIISSGNSEKVATARRTIIYAFVGLTFIIFSWPIVGYVVNALTK